MDRLEIKPHNVTLTRHEYFLNSWVADHVRNVEVLLRVNEQRNILYEIRKRKAN